MGLCPVMSWCFATIVNCKCYLVNYLPVKKLFGFLHILARDSTMKLSPLKKVASCNRNTKKVS